MIHVSLYTKKRKQQLNTTSSQNELTMPLVGRHSLRLTADIQTEQINRQTKHGQTNGHTIVSALISLPIPELDSSMGIGKMLLNDTSTVGLAPQKLTNMVLSW